MTHPHKFAEFISNFTSMIDAHAGDEAAILAGGKSLLAQLVAADDWLPVAASVPDETYYQQYLLHLDPQSRFSVVSFVWGPGQRTPVHDHGVWALIGMLRGAERSELFAWDGDGSPMRALGAEVLNPGAVEHVSPRVGDIHRVSNVYDDRVSISVHVYGGDIGSLSRHTSNAETGARKTFVSGYSTIAAAA